MWVPGCESRPGRLSEMFCGHTGTALGPIFVVPQLITVQSVQYYGPAAVGLRSSVSDVTAL